MEGDQFLQIYESAFNLMSHYNAKHETLSAQLETHPLLSQLQHLTPTSLNLPPLNTLTDDIFVRTLIQKNKIRLSLYYMPAGKVMHLHNHPHMLVISYLILGHINAKIYTLINNEMHFKKEEVGLYAGKHTCIDGRRSMEHNLHELKAEENSIFLDIICPDYDDNRRICRYFKEVEQVGDKVWRLQQIFPTEEQLKLLQM